MSPEQHPSEMEQLDLLAVELAESGKIARVSTAHRGRPDPVFTMRLRNELLSSFGSVAMVKLEEAEAPTLISPMPAPVDVDSDIDLVAFEARDQDAAPQPFAPPAAVEPFRPSLARFGRLVRSPRDVGRRPVAVMAAAEAGTQVDPAPREPTGRASVRGNVRFLLHPSGKPSRFVGLGLAACLALLAVLLGSGLMAPVKAPARVDQAIAASLVHGDGLTPLAAGALLTQGDEIRVGTGGLAYLTVADSIVRLDAGADVRLDSLDARDLQVAQLAGRVYHRVLLPHGGSYRVLTGGVVWQATGTAFDLDRRTTAATDQVLGLALQHDLRVTGSGVDASVPQGTSALVTLASSSSAGSAATSPIGSSTLDNPWLLANAALDARLGLPLGLLADAAHITARPATTAGPTDAPPTADVPVETAAATPAVPTATPAPPTHAPTARPTAAPTKPGIPNLGSLSVTDTGGGTYSFSWPKYTGSGFEYYKLVYAPWGTNPTYNGSNYWACPSNPADTSWSGAVDPGNWGVRLQVIDTTSGKVVVRAQTNVVHLNVPLPPTKELGALNVQDNGNGTYTFSWPKYSGSFNYYKLVFGPPGSSPTYPGGSPYWAVPGTNQTSVTLTVGAGNGGNAKFDPGNWSVRIQAIGYPGGNAYAFAETSAVPVTVVPAPMPTPTASPTPTPTPTLTPTASPT